MALIREQQKMFVEYLIEQNMKNATKAAIRAGYSKKSASTQASDLLKKTEVSEYLKKRENEEISKIQKRFAFGASVALDVLYKIMTDPEADYRDRLAAAKDYLDRAGFKSKDKYVIPPKIKFALDT